MYALIENQIVKQIVEAKFPFAETETIFFIEYNQDNTFVEEDYLYQNGKFINPITIDIEKNLKIKELENYHNSDEVKNLTINNINDFKMNQEGRGLISEQINSLHLQIKLNLITEEEAKFTYVNGGTIDFSLLQLEQLYIQMMSIVKQNYITYINHKKTIQNLSIIEDEIDENNNIVQVGVKNYDFTEGYIKNSTLTL
jgi:hypothetical protein